MRHTARASYLILSRKRREKDRKRKTERERERERERFGGEYLVQDAN
jgi:hypothetical protein